MPRRKGKIEKAKKELPEKLKQGEAMNKRLMVINLKIDDYVYKKKPISIEEADMYTREIEQFRHQCRNEQSLQVIEKLISYMECIIREKSPKDIANSVIGPIENSTEKFKNENDHNMQVDEISISKFSSLSIVEPKDALDISTINNNTYQEKEKLENSTSTVTTERMAKGTKPIVFCPEIKRTTPEIENLRDITQKETAVDGSKHSQKILNNFEYEICNSSNKLRNYRKTKNDQTEKAFENTNVIITNHGTINIKNSIDNSKTSNLNLKDVDDNSQLSPNMFSNFEYENFTPMNINPKNVIFVPNNVTDTRNNEEEITSLNEVSNVNTIKLKDLHISTDKHVPCNFENRNTNAGCVFQNNTNFNNIQQSNIINELNIADNTNNATSYNKMNRGFTYEKIDINSRNNRNEIGRECEPKHLPSNFEQINNNSSQTFNTPIFTSQIHSQLQGNETEKVKKRRKCVRKDKVEATRNTVNVAKNNSQKQANGIEKVKKRKTVIRDIAKTQPMRQNKQNVVNVSTSQCIVSKEEIVNPDQIVTNVKSDNLKQKKQRKLLTNKRALDLSWADNIKFLRVIEKEEFTKVDNLDESFWSNASLPPNIINLNDFECDDNINIWK